MRCQAKYENEARAQGYQRIAGVDEVGRGALFGPVFAAAVILSTDRPIRGLRDSKLLDAEKLNPAADYLLVDAVKVDLPLSQRALIHGDALSQCIAAASILAKVTRDACLREWDLVFPQYGLKNHKGYSTDQHWKALETHGPTPMHRFSFWTGYPRQGDLFVEGDDAAEPQPQELVQEAACAR